MNLRQIRQFVSLAEHLNFHRAAEALHMSQPPLSISIRKLETGLGAALFERHARGVSLTEAGARALRPAREVLRAVEELSHAVRDTAAGLQGTLRVGFVGSATYGLIPSIIKKFHDLYPGLDLSLREATSLEVLAGLADATLDIGVVRTPLNEGTTMSLTPLNAEPMILLTPTAHRLAGAKRVRLESLSSESLILYDRTRVPSLHSQLVLACDAAGFSPRVVEHATHIHTMIALVESGLGLGFAPAVVRRAAEGRVHCADLTVEGRSLRLSCSLAVRPNESRPAVNAFVHVALNAAR